MTRIRDLAYSSRMADFQDSDHEDDEPGALVIVALLVGLPLLGGMLLYLIAGSCETMQGHRDGYAFIGALAGFVSGAVVRHLLIRTRH